MEARLLFVRLQKQRIIIIKLVLHHGELNAAKKEFLEFMQMLPNFEISLTEK